MNARHRRTTLAVAACLLYHAFEGEPAHGQIGATDSTFEILAGQPGSLSSSTTAVALGEAFPNEPTNVLTTRVGFNVNADAEPGLVAIGIGLVSFDVRFAVDHGAAFDLTFDFLLRGQVLRFPDEDGCQGSITFGDIAIPTVQRLSDEAEFPLDILLPGVTFDLDGTTSSLNLAEQDSGTVSFRDARVETTAYRLKFVASVTAISQSCEVSARFGADNGTTTGCDGCVYPGVGDRIRDDDGLFITLTFTNLCGNGAIDGSEQCDFGELNAADGSCCDAFCRFAPSDRVCRSAAVECDQEERCSGASAVCPEDLVKRPGAPCTADRSPCTDDICGANLECVHPPIEGATCEDGLCTCDNDGLFCNGLVRCGTSLCIVLPPPCGEDDTCDEENNVCLTPFGTATLTPTATAVDSTPAAATPTATSVTSAAPSPTPTSTGATPGAATPTATVATDACTGDCNGDRRVLINEVVLGVNITLGGQSVSACPAFDRNGDQLIAINELVAGVSNVLAGCST